MRKATKVLLLAAGGIIILSIGAVAGGLTIFKNQTNSSLLSPAVLPGNVFDTTYPIPGTSASFSYPKKGFYGLGAVVDSYPAEDPGDSVTKSVMVRTTAPYDSERGSEFVTLTIGVNQHFSKDTTFQQFVDSFDPQGIEAQYATINGTYKTINNHEFFVDQVMEDVTVWNAYTLLDGNLVSIIFAYKLGDGAESQAAYLYNDQLFLQILSHITFD